MNFQPDQLYIFKIFQNNQISFIFLQFYILDIERVFFLLRPQTFQNYTIKFN